MEFKFIVLSWTVEPMGWYDGGDKKDQCPIEEAFDPEIELAYHFNTYQEAEDQIKLLPGGTYQIEKVFLKD